MDTVTGLGIEPQPQPSEPPKKSYNILGWLGIGLGSFMALFHAWAWGYGNVDAQVLGYAVGCSVPPALIAYLVAGRKSIRDFNRFGVWFSGLSILFFLVGFHPVPLEQHVRDLMKEAAGTKPVDNNGAPGRSLDEQVRDTMRMVLEERKAFDKDIGQYKPDMARLYTTESFSNKEAMQRCVDAVKGAIAVDQRYSQQLDTLPQRLEERLSKSDVDSDFMSGVRKTYANSTVLNIRRQAMSVEAEWADATVRLYELAMLHTRVIQVDGSHLRISNEKIRAEFNERMKKSLTLRDNLNKLNTDLEHVQRELMSQIGVTAADLGIENGDDRLENDERK